MLRITLVTLAILTLARPGVAQNPYLLEVYGDGVHAFHRGEFDRACLQFNKAIENGSRDPRVFYYRALKCLQQGDRASAEQDIQTGVMFEMRGQGTWDIGMALERIQGPHRIEFEDLRLDAKLALSGRPPEEPRRVQPYLDPLDIDDSPLADELPTGPSFGDEPFAEDESDDAAEDASDLDLDDSMDTEESPSEPGDEFGEPAMDEGAEPGMSDEDPFGDDPVDDSDPFADDAAADDGFGMDDTTPAADEDPFGDDPLDENPFE